MTAHIIAGGDEGVPLLTESNPILDLALDTTGSCSSLWVATTATHVNKWPVDATQMNGFAVEGEGSSDEEDETGVTYIDEAEPTPIFAKPILTLPGDYRILIHEPPPLPSPLYPPPTFRLPSPLYPPLYTLH